MRMARLSWMIWLLEMFGFSHRKSHGKQFHKTYTNKLSSRGVPHSIQALDDGVEFLLVFDDGDFNEDNTFLATEVFLHSPVRPSEFSFYLDKLSSLHYRKRFWPKISGFLLQPLTISRMTSSTSSRARLHQRISRNKM